VARSAGVVFFKSTLRALARSAHMARACSNLTVLKPRRQRLRSSMTPAEIRLWQALKGRQLSGRKFRRQHSIGFFVLDFFCPAEGLAVELDGSSHDSAAANERDQNRDAFLASVGIRVVRFENRDVMENLEGVLAGISAPKQR
jgi:very-short-patch-repair endonuclease